MSARAEQKAKARAARLERERAEKAAATRRKRLLGLVGAVLAAVVVAGGLIAASQIGSDDSSTTGSQGDASQVSGGSEVGAMLAGIPQNGRFLGDPKAPVVLTEFGDLQCPACRQYSQEILPGLISDYVKAGKVRLEFQPVSILGEDSEKAARMSAAAGEQDKMWTFNEVFYANQGQENTGYVTDEFLRSIGDATPGLDTEKALAVANQSDSPAALITAAGLFQQYNLTGTPSFLIAERGKTPEPLQITAFEAKQFTDPIDALLK
jgi:protein-disulfide isomerase